MMLGDIPYVTGRYHRDETAGEPAHGPDIGRSRTGKNSLKRRVGNPLRQALAEAARDKKVALECAPAQQQDRHAMEAGLDCPPHAQCLPMHRDAPLQHMFTMWKVPKGPMSGWWQEKPPRPVRG